MPVEQKYNFNQILVVQNKNSKYFERGKAQNASLPVKPLFVAHYVVAVAKMQKESCKNE